MRISFHVSPSSKDLHRERGSRSIKQTRKATIILCIVIDCVNYVLSEPTEIHIIVDLDATWEPGQSERADDVSDQVTRSMSRGFSESQCGACFFFLRRQYPDWNERLEGMHHGPTSFLPSVDVHRSRAKRHSSHCISRYCSKGFSRVCLMGWEASRLWRTSQLAPWDIFGPLSNVSALELERCSLSESDQFLLIYFWTKHRMYTDGRYKWANLTMIRNIFLNRHANV